MTELGRRATELARDIKLKKLGPQKAKWSDKIQEELSKFFLFADIKITLNPSENGCGVWKNKKEENRMKKLLREGV